MQQAVGGLDLGEEGTQRRHDALFVQHPHVADRHLGIEQPGMFGGVDRADAVKADALGRDRGGEGRKGVEAGFARDIGDRRAVQVA